MKYIYPYLILILTVVFANPAFAGRWFVKDSSDDYVHRCETLILSQQYEKAIEVLSTAINLHPSTNGFWHRQRADCYQKLGKLRESALDDQEHEKFIERPSLAHAQFLATRPARTAELRDELKVLLKHGPTTPELLYAVSELKRTSGDYYGASRNLTTALTLLKEDHYGKSLYLRKRSEVFEQMHQYSRALEDTNSVIELSPIEPELYQRRARLSNILGFDGATKDIQLAEQLKLKNRYDQPLYKKSPKAPTSHDDALLEVVRLIEKADPFKVRDHAVSDAKLMYNIDCKLTQCLTNLHSYFGTRTLMLDLASRHNLSLEYVKERLGFVPNATWSFPLNGRLIYERDWGNIIFDVSTELPERVKDVKFIAKSEISTEMMVFLMGVAADPPPPTTEEEERFSCRFRLPEPCYGRRESIACASDANRAILVYSKLLELPGLPLSARKHALLQRGKAYEFKNYYIEALADQRELISLLTDTSEEITPKLDCVRLLRKLRRTDEALMEINAIIDEWPCCHQKVSLWCERAEILTKLGRCAKAIDDYSKALQTEDNTGELNLKRGKLRLLAGDSLGALDDFHAAANRFTFDRNKERQSEAAQQRKVAQFFIEQEQLEQRLPKS